MPAGLFHFHTMPTQQSSLAGRGEQRTEFEIPLLGRAASVGTVDVAARTVDLVWTTGAPVKRYDYYRDRWYLEELSLDPAHVRMGRLQSGAANLLNTHSRWDLSSVLGVVTKADLGNGEGTASVRFSQRDDVQPYFQDVVDGIIRSVSVGYAIYAVEMIAPTDDGGVWTYRAVDWEPYELSLVPIPADAGAMTRAAASGGGTEGHAQRTFLCAFTEVAQPLAAAGTQSRKGNLMDGQTNTQPAAQPQAVSATPATPSADDQQRALDAARQAGAAQEAQRQLDIREAVRLGGLEPAFAETLVAQREMTSDAAGLAVLREIHQRSAANPTRSPSQIYTISDETDNRRQAMGDAIVLRAKPDIAMPAERKEAARQWRGMNLIDMARESIELAGGSCRGLAKREIAVMAMNLDRDMQVRGGMNSTSDFPAVLGNTVNRSLRQAYDLQPRTFTAWCNQSSAPDFKEVARIQMSALSAFQKINEGGEYKRLVFGDSAEKYSLSKYGGIIAITWESLVNDDLSAFIRIPMMIAAEAAGTESDIVYGIITKNPAMSDGKSLFSSNHGNLAAAGTALDATSLSAGRVAMRKQEAGKGRVLNLTPSYLIVGADNESAANKYTSTNFVAAKSVDINPAYNTSLEVVTEARITGWQWLLAAAPGLVDTVEYTYLEGEEGGVFTEQRNGFEVDGLQIKARHVFAAKAIDWRGLYSNSGAAPE